MGKEPEKKSVLISIILGFFAILGVLFIIIMLMPDDEDEEDGKDS